MGRKSIEKPTITVAIPPTIICPSAPILNNPALKANAIPKAANTSGVAAVKVSDKALNDPTEPINRLEYATNILEKLSPVARRKKHPISSARMVAKIGTNKISLRFKLSVTSFCLI